MTPDEKKRWAVGLIKRSLMTIMLVRRIYHESRTGCPTWTDAAECRCMVEPL